ncbi:hypothetical protein ElyMa_003853200 [Elysia marginata]|uniref:Uncharacterized protein n=1 Tax=Elysia marginata TaxID=1093978 RepID=A0AAV4FHK5_9GAST|nr:hypothetical protein ElyMa_003853200 [Elysia marginata]
MSFVLVFVTPGVAGLTGGAGGKKPPIIIVSNKKGMSGSVVRGGSILQTLPYGNSGTVMSALRPSLLKPGTIKTLDASGGEAKSTLGGVITTSTPSSNSGQTNTGKITTLADLIADVNDSTSWEPGKKTSEGGTQLESGSGGAPVNKPVIVLPSLAVRTPRPVTSIQSSTVATTSPGGGTVVIMPTKPVISMGTKRAPKSRPRKSAKNKLGPPEQDSTTRKPGVSLLTGEVKPGVSSSMGTSMSSSSSSGSAVFSSVSSVTTTVAAANTPTMSTSSSGTQSQQGPQVSSANQTTETSQQQQHHHHHPQNQQQQQGQQSSFPDLNRMWQNNFGSMPPVGANSSNNNNQQTVGPNNFPHSNKNNANSNSNAVSGNSGFMMPNSSNQPQGPATMQTQPSGASVNNQNMGGFGGQQMGIPGTNNQQPYGAMNNTYMPGNMGQSGNMGPYGPGQAPAAGGQNFSGPYMSGFHPGYMGPPTGPFGQNMHTPIQNQNLVRPSQQGMYGGGSQNPAPGNFGPSSSSFGMQGEGNQQGPFGGNTSFPNNSGGQVPFGQNQSNMQDQSSLSSLLSDTKVDHNFSQPASSLAPPAPSIPLTSSSQSPSRFLAPNNPNKQPASMFDHDSSGNFPPPSSSVSHSVGGMLASPAKPGGNSRDPSPFSLTMLGSDSSSSSNADALSANNEKRSKSSSKTKGSGSSAAGSKSKSSKKKSSSSSNTGSSSTQIPSENAAAGPQRSSGSQSGNSNKQQQQQTKSSTLNIPSPGPLRHQNNASLGDNSGNSSRPSSHTSVGGADQAGVSGPPAFGNLMPGPALNTSSSSSNMTATSNSNNSIINFPSFQPTLGSVGGGGSSGAFESSLDAFGIPPLSSSLSSMMGSGPLSSEMGMGGSAFRAHQSSSVPASSAPLGIPPSSINSASPFGSISNMPGLGFNSGMSAFAGGFGGGGYGGMPASFGGYGGGYGAGAFSSGMMPPHPASSQPMMGYGHPQAALGYPSMSSLMMGAPAPPPAGPGAMWPMMTPPTAMIGTGYGYPTPHASMGFPAPGLDGQGFGSLGPGPSNN